MQDRAGDVVRQVRDHVVRRRRRGGSGPGRARRPPRAGAGPASSGSANRSRRNAASPRSSSTAVTAAPASSSAPVSSPRPGPISRMPRPGAGRGLGEDRVEHVDVGEEVLRHRVPGAQAGRAEASPGPRRRPGAAGPRRSPGRPAGSDGRASRSRPARSPAANRRPPAAPIMAPLSVHSAGPRHDQRDAHGLGLPGEAAAQDAVRRHAAAEHDRARAERAGGPDRLGHQDVDDGVLEAPGQLRHDRRRGAARPAGPRGPRRPARPPRCDGPRS